MKEHEEYMGALHKALNVVDLEMLGCVSVIGSSIDGLSEQSHDLDVMVLPCDAQKPGRTYCAMADLFKVADIYFMESTGRITSTVPCKHLQAKTNWIIGKTHNTEPVDIHTLIFPDSESFYSFNPETFLTYAMANHVNLYGSMQDAIEEMPSTSDRRKLEAMTLVYQMNTLQENGKVPTTLIEKEIESLFRYFKKIYGINVSLPNNSDDYGVAIGDLILVIDDEPLSTRYTEGDWS